MLLVNHIITMSKQIKAFPPMIIAALAGFTVIGAAIATYIPNYNLTQYFGWIGTDEWRLKLGVMTYLLFVLTAVILWVARKTLKLPLSWFLYALLFNGLIVFIKFISSPNTYGDLASNTLVFTAAGVGLLYIIGLWLVYLFFQGKILKTLSSASKNSEEQKFLFATGLFVFINFLRLVVFSLPPLANTSTANYLSSIFRGGGLIFSIIIFLVILGSVEAFDKARHNNSTLRNVFILGVSMLVIYHIFWVIFVKALGGCGC